MLIVNPEERVNINDVVKYCEEQIKVVEKRGNSSALSGRDQDSTPVKRKFQIDPCLIMDDIVEKLGLLDYSSKFCIRRNYKPVSRTYFALKQEQSESTEVKVQYFVELCYWLMSLGYEDSVR